MISPSKKYAIRWLKWETQAIRSHNETWQLCVSRETFGFASNQLWYLESATRMFHVKHSRKRTGKCGSLFHVKQYSSCTIFRH